MVLFRQWLIYSSDQQQCLLYALDLFILAEVGLRQVRDDTIFVGMQSSSLKCYRRGYRVDSIATGYADG